jgi:hypothetical protein
MRKRKWVLLRILMGWLNVFLGKLTPIFDIKIAVKKPCNFWTFSSNLAFLSPQSPLRLSFLTYSSFSNLRDIGTLPLWFLECSWGGVCPGKIMPVGYSASVWQWQLSPALCQGGVSTSHPGHSVDIPKEQKMRQSGVRWCLHQFVLLEGGHKHSGKSHDGFWPLKHFPIICLGKKDGDGTLWPFPLEGQAPN